MNSEILKAHHDRETKAIALDALSNVLYHFDVDIYVEGVAPKATHHIRLWQEGDDKGEVEASTLSEALALAVELSQRLLFPEHKPPREPEKQPLNIVYAQLTAMEIGRLNKALKRVYRFDLGTMSLSLYLHRLTFHRKSQQTRYYSRKRYCLEYKKLAQPLTDYTLWHLDDDGLELGTEVPKIVFDALPDIPEITYEQWYLRQKGTR